MSDGYSVEAVVLGSRKFGERDRMATVLTRERGRLRLVVRGAARPGSKLAPVTQPFDCVRLNVYRGRSLDGVRGGEVVHSMRRLRSDPDVLGFAYCLAEIASYLGQEEEADEPLYLLLLTCFRALAAGVSGLLVATFFVIRAAGVAGFSPVLSECVGCGGDAEGDVHFSFPTGGVLCRDCARRAGGAGAALTRKQRELAAWLARAHPKELSRYEGGERTLRRLLGPFLDFLQYQMERRVNSRDFLDMLG